MRREGEGCAATRSLLASLVLLATACTGGADDRPRMRIGRLVLTAPRSWLATGVVCVVVDGGRSACLSPYAVRLGRTAEYRYDPAMPWGQLRF